MRFWLFKKPSRSFISMEVERTILKQDIDSHYLRGINMEGAIPQVTWEIECGPYILQELLHKRFL